MEKPFCPTCEQQFEPDLKFCPHDATPLVIRSADSMTGKVFDERYQILHKIGEGGMGAVYKAIQRSTGKTTAIKVISPSLANNEDTIQRFQREVKIQSKLEHPNIVNVIDFSKTPEGQYYFVMAFVEGRSLRRMILDDGRFTVEAFMELATQALDGLEYAHNQKIVHRDLKTDNIIVVPLPHQRIVKILDFGLAKAIQSGGTTMDSELTQQGRVMGTPSYMSPEQAKGEIDNIGPWSDVYSMGVIFYQMLSGQLPFQSDTPWGVMHKQIHEPPPPLREINPDVPEHIELVISRCLEKEPSARYASALQVRKDLTEKAGEPFGVAEETMMATPPIPRARPGTKGLPGAAIAAAAAAVLMIGGAGYWMFSKPSRQISQPAPRVAPSAPEKTKLAIIPPVKEKKVVKAPVLRKGPVAMYRGGPARAGWYEGKGVESLSGEKWRVDTSDWVSSSPVIAAGAVHFGDDDGFLYAVDAVSGEVRWKFKAQKAITSSPAVAHEMVYAGSDDGLLYALDMKTGKLQWTFETGGPVISSPAVAGGVVYFGSADGKVYALHAGDGAVQWEFTTIGQVNSSPAVSGGVVFFGGSDGRCYAVNAKTGKQKWSFRTKDAVASSPAVSGSMVFFGSDDGHLYALDEATGALKWKYETGDRVRASPAVAEKFILFGGKDGFFYALDAATGARRWRFETNDSIFSSSAVAGSTVYFGSDDGHLYALDVATGKKKWAYDAGKPIASSPAVAGALVYFGSQDNSLRALQ